MDKAVDKIVLGEIIYCFLFGLCLEIKIFDILILTIKENQIQDIDNLYF